MSRSLSTLAAALLLAAAGAAHAHRDPFREQPSPPAERHDAERPYALTGDRNGRSDDGGAAYRSFFARCSIRSTQRVE
jgi:hypothetical protein